MSAMVSERSESEEVDEAVEDPVEDEMEERCDDADGGEALENTCKGSRAQSYRCKEHVSEHNRH